MPFWHPAEIIPSPIPCLPSTRHHQREAALASRDVNLTALCKVLKLPIKEQR